MRASESEVGEYTVTGRLGRVEPKQKKALLVGLLAAGSIVVLDFFVVLVCLPAIADTLRATQTQLQLIMVVYASANASMLIVGGRIGDLFGRSRTLRWGVGAFALASLACGVSTSAVALIVSRGVQGVAGAMIHPQVLGLLRSAFSTEERPRVFGLYAACLGVAGAAAQLLGGLLVELLPSGVGWRACFIVTLPLCGLAWLGLAAHAEEGPHMQARTVDAVGAVLLGLALACVSVFLTMGRDQGWPAWSFAVLAAGTASLALFVRWVRPGRDADRLLPPGILVADRLWLQLLTVFVFFGGAASLYFVLSLELRKSGFSPIQVGLWFGWLSACFMASSAGSLQRWAGSHWAEAGLASMLVGHLLMLLSGEQLHGAQQALGFFASCGLQGLGAGYLMGPLIANTVACVGPEHASVGGGITATTQQVGNSLGIAAIGAAYFRSDGGMGTTSLTGAVVYLLAVMVLLMLLLDLGRRMEPT